MTGLLVAVRLRGHIGLHPDVKKTLELLNLKGANHATIIPDDEAHRGMLRKVEPYITWGEPNKDTILALLKKMEVKGDGRLSDEVAEKLGLRSLEELAERLVQQDGETLLKKLKRQNAKPYARLHPPRKGFKYSIKRPYKDKGEHGYRGQAINELIRRMV
ncbi:MAG: 50S ribosomal protein L30 [Aigarchaeota archaeon]|nr:50S ribosomal protein L30 [Candidatus Pelearchaeum maunauluense]